MLTLRGATRREVSARQPLCADIDGFKLYAAVRVEAHGRRRLEHLCRYITRLALSDERVQVNAARQVEFKLKTPWHDGTTHLVMSPLEFTQRLAALVPRPRLHLLMTASWLPFHAIGCPVWVGHCRPRTSALRSLNLDVSFPAVRSLTLLSLTDPEPPVALLQSCPTLGPASFGFGVYEPAVRDHRDPASSCRWRRADFWHLA